MHAGGLLKARQDYMARRQVCPDCVPQLPFLQISISNRKFNLVHDIRNISHFGGVRQKRIKEDPKGISIGGPTMFCIQPQSNRKAAQRRRINKGEVYR